MDAYSKLERELAKWVGVPYDNMVVCSSGTAALHLALECLQLPRGCQVVVPEFTMIACARAVAMADMRPVFVDCQEDLNLDPTKLVACLSPLTRAIMPVHIYGRPCNMPAVLPFARLNGLAVIEDMSEVHGHPPCPESDAACWSFYRNKIVAGEEGGAVWFKDIRHAVLARSLRTHGFNSSHDFLHAPRGVNCRLSNLHAKVILGSLRAYEHNINRRREIVEWYNEATPVEWQMPFRKYPWVYDLRLPEGASVGNIVSSFVKHGIAARQAFKPMSEQPEFIGHHQHLEAYRQSRRVMYLPLSPDMTREDVQRAAALWA